MRIFLQCVIMSLPPYSLPLLVSFQIHFVALGKSSTCTERTTESRKTYTFSVIYFLAIRYENPCQSVSLRFGARDPCGADHMVGRGGNYREMIPELGQTLFESRFPLADLTKLFDVPGRAEKLETSNSASDR